MFPVVAKELLCAHFTKRIYDGVQYNTLMQLQRTCCMSVVRGGTDEGHRGRELCFLGTFGHGGMYKLNFTYYIVIIISFKLISKESNASTKLNQFSILHTYTHKAFSIRHILTHKFRALLLIHTILKVAAKSLGKGKRLHIL